MKTELTFEQNRHLINLGVPKEKASIWNKDIVIFKLEDFLNGEILPKELYSETYLDDLGNQTVPDSYGNYELVMRRWYKKWAVWYENKEDWQLCSKCFESDELIDALYQYTCWYYGEFLKSEKR